MSNQYRCLTCARLNDGTDNYAVKLRSDEGEVIDGTSSKELYPDEYYGLSGVKVIQRTQTPRPEAADQPKDKANAQNSKVSDISTDSVTGGEKVVNAERAAPAKAEVVKAPAKKAAPKTTAKATKSADTKKVSVKKK